jgi:hypothetical protein
LDWVYLKEEERENREGMGFGVTRKGAGDLLLNDHLLHPPQFRKEGGRRLWGGRPAAIASEPGHDSGRDVG